MAWDTKHKVYNSTGSVEMTTGYFSETITLGNNADASTSALPGPVKSDMTILIIFSHDITVDTYIQVEHSLQSLPLGTWFKQGAFEEDASVDHDDISKNMAKLGAIDASIMGDLSSNGMMLLYDIDTHGTGRHVRFTVKANGQNESSKTATFYVIPHF